MDLTYAHLEADDMAREVAEILSEATGAQVTAVYGGYRVKETRTHYIDVVRMIYNWRVVWVPKSSPLTVDRHWCYQGVDWVALLRAAGAALEWDGQPGTEPSGWHKNGQTQVWRPPADDDDLEWLHALFDRPAGSMPDSLV